MSAMKVDLTTAGPFLARRPSMAMTDALRDSTRARLLHAG